MTKKEKGVRCITASFSFFAHTEKGAVFQRIAERRAKERKTDGLL